MALKKILPADLEGKGVKGQTDTPGLTAAQMQEKVEEIVRAVVIAVFNQNAENTYDKNEVNAAIDAKMQAIGAGDMAKSVYGGSVDGVVKASDKLATPRKIGNADFDGTKNITLAQMGIDLSDTNYTITPAANVSSAGFAELSKNAIKGIRYKMLLQVAKSVVVGTGNVLGTTNALLNADINLSVPCYVSQQGVGVYMGILLFAVDKSIMLLCDHALTYTPGATYPIMVYACNQ